MSEGSAVNVETRPSVKAIDRCLPQTQCTRCGYPRCRDYARAIVRGESDINRCPPGGDTTISRLSALLNKPRKPLDPECGDHGERVLARVIEHQCIGCTLCIQVCPVDAIIGRAKRMHTVIDQLCTGCELCLPVCPVDCIELVPDTIHQPDAVAPWPDYGTDETSRARRHTVLRLRRLARRKREREAAKQTRILSESERIRADIRAAVERVKQKRNTP
jgi:electron transport complex protein RnfB